MIVPLQQVERLGLSPAWFEVCFDLDGQSSVLDFLRQISLHQNPFAFIVLLFGHNQVELDWFTTLNLAKLLA